MSIRWKLFASYLLVILVAVVTLGLYLNHELGRHYLGSLEDGLFSQATRIPLMSFSRSKGSRLPSFFMTMSGTRSTYSYVVKRRLHFRHSRRRLTLEPFFDPRESITLSFLLPQYGHRMYKL